MNKVFSYINIAAFLFFSFVAFGLATHSSSDHFILIYSFSRFIILLFVLSCVFYFGASVFSKKLSEFNVLLLFGIFIGLIIVEAAFSIFPGLFPLKYINTFEIGDSLRVKIAKAHGLQVRNDLIKGDGLFYTFKPYSTVKQSSPVHKLYGEAKIDDIGYRNSLVKQKKTDIVLLGDSMTFGHGSPIDLGAILRDKGYKVLNLGMDGYGPQYYLESFLRYGKRTKPKYVFIFLFEGNDFYNVLTYRDLNSKAGATYKDYLNTGVGNPCLLSNWSIFDELIKRSYLASFVRGSILYYSNLTQDLYPIGEPPVLSDIKANRSFDLAIDSILEIKKACNSIGAKTYLVYLPSDSAIYAAISGKNKRHEKNSKEASKATKQKCEMNNIAFIDPRGVFCDRMKDKVIYLRDNAHLHPQGITVLSEIILKNIKR